MDSSTFILSIPLIILSLLSIIKLINNQSGNKKPWFRIEEVEENE